jgi:alkanesulfonate monooxygenase SsuD/methylene tetrahydromethanopterin reductase-like flavin-dependent oxidoreductase (luciferase family)
VFINGPSKQVIAPIVADIRRRAAAAGRNAAEILIFTMMTVITARTSDDARAKLEEYRSYASEEGALVLMFGWTGVDFSRYGLDEPLRHSREDAQKPSRLPIRPECGRCGKSQNTPLSGVAGRSWSARPGRSRMN